MARRKIIPKRLGGVKIPKRLRKLGDRVLADPRAREAAGSALLALGTALLARGTRPGSVLRDIFGPRDEGAKAARDAESGAGHRADRAGEAANRAGEAMSGMADAVAQTVGEVIDALRRDISRKVRPVRPRHAHDEPEGEEGPGGGEDRMH